MRLLGKALTFDDVLLVPAFSQVLPKDTSLKTRFSRDISRNIPLVSAAMDTVTEARLAIAIAQEGGIGVIQEATREAVAATGSVEASIERVSAISTSIATTLEQQSAAVGEISRAISGTLSAVGGLADDMQRLMGNAASTDGKSAEVAEAARRMRGDTGLLLTQVDRLTRALKAG